MALPRRPPAWVLALIVLPTLVFFVVASAVGARLDASKAPPTVDTPSTFRPGALPVAFEPDAGRFGHDVRYMARGSGYSVFLTGSGAVLALRGVHGRSAVLRSRLVGATPRSVTGADRLPGKVSQFTSSDRRKWVHGLPTFGAISYKSAWPGIDVRYHGRGSSLEYDFVVAPGADAGRIGLRLSGAR